MRPDFYYRFVDFVKIYGTCRGSDWQGLRLISTKHYASGFRAGKCIDVTIFKVPSKCDLSHIPRGHPFIPYFNAYGQLVDMETAVLNDDDELISDYV